MIVKVSYLLCNYQVVSIFVKIFYTTQYCIYTMSEQKITIDNGKLNVPDQPVIPFIEVDGTGPDIWQPHKRVLDAAVEKAYQGQKKIIWKEVLAGEKAFNQTGEWLPTGHIRCLQ